LEDGIEQKSVIASFAQYLGLKINAFVVADVADPAQ
jgi:hypothetical protein